jgi:DNA-binding MltR family transcriptional regulator
MRVSNMRRSIVPVEKLSEETRQLFDVLNKESDLACVVIAAAFLDTALVSLLAQKLLASSVSNKLLATSGALGSFATRADLAYCLSLIKKEHYQDICVVGEIRNQFAHSHLQLSFEDGNIRQLCDRLNEWRVILHGEEEEQVGYMTEAQLGARARNQFNLSVAFLANWILLNALSLKAKAT